MPTVSNEVLLRLASALFAGIGAAVETKTVEIEGMAVRGAVTAENLPALVEALERRVAELEASRATGLTPLSLTAEAVPPVPTLRPALDAAKPGPDAEDPWKGFSGVVPERRRTATRELAAAVTDRGHGLYDVVITVRSPDPDRRLVGPVGLLLHDTFPLPRRVVEPVDGEARVRLVAWGAFTVGCIDDEGQRLEYDLGADASFPKGFREA